MQTVDIRTMGVVEYTDALEMMSTLQQQRIKEEIPDLTLSALSVHDSSTPVNPMN